MRWMRAEARQKERLRSSLLIDPAPKVTKAERMIPMLNTRQLEEIIDGCAFLESSSGNLYEFIGFDGDDRLCFQNVNDDSHIEVKRERLLRDPGYDIQY